MQENDLDLEPGTLDTDAVTVRNLRADDLDWMVRVDQEHSGRARREYYQVKLKEAHNDTGIRISLAAEIDGEPAGFLMGRLYYGEFGLPEPVAQLDTIAVARRHSGKKVAKALMRQLRMNLHGLGIDHIQTEVAWNNWQLLSFFERIGFKPAARVCLEMSVD